MRVVNANRTGIEDAEKQVLTALQAWQVPGIVVPGVPVRSTSELSGEAHLLMLLPDTAVAIQVYEVPWRVGGVFRCPAQGKWSLTGGSDGGVYSKRDENPLPAVRQLMGETRSAVERATGAALTVQALVIVVPPEKFRVTLEKVDFPTFDGLDVLLLESGWRALREWADERVSGSEEWTAGRVLALLRGFGFTEDGPDPDSGVTLRELADIGFRGPPDPMTGVTGGPVSPIRSMTTSPPPPPLAGGGASAQDPPGESWLRNVRGHAAVVMTKLRRRQWLLAGVVAAVWLGIMAVVGPALTPDHGAGSGSVVTTSVPGVTTSPAPPK